jgi:hypothetical protein
MVTIHHRAYDDCVADAASKADVGPPRFAKNDTGGVLANR